MTSYQEIFSKRADTYHSAMQQWPLARAEEFKLLIEQVHLKSGFKIADLPSGGGYLSQFIPIKDIKLTFLETADYFYQHCPEQVNYERYLCALDAIPLPSEHFDCLFSLAGLHHVTDRKAVYQECFRLLVNQGICVIADADEHSTVARFLNEFVDQYNSMGHQGLFLNAKDTDLLKQIGFHIQTDHSINYTWNFDHPSSMAEFCKMTFGLDKANHEQVLTGIADYLGIVSKGKQASMNWNLRFITVQKSAC